MIYEKQHFWPILLHSLISNIMSWILYICILENDATLTVCNDHGTESTMHISHFLLNILCFFYSRKETYQPRTMHMQGWYLSYLVIWFWSSMAVWYLSFSVCSSGPWTPDIFRRHPVLLLAFLSVYVFLCGDLFFIY